jgi:spore germination protein YaaH
VAPAVLGVLGVLGVLAATGCGVGLPFGLGGRDELWGIASPPDARSAASAAAHAGALDVVIDGWIALDSVTGAPLLDSAAAAPGARPARRMAVVSTFTGNRAHPELVRALANDDAALGRVAAVLASRVTGAGFAGIVVDFEEHDARDVDALVKVVRALGDSARAAGIAPVVVAVPAGDTAAYPARPLLAGADLVLVELYDQHWGGSSPGTVAAPDWVRQQLGRRVAEVGGGRLVASLPLHGYAWRTGGGAQLVSFEQARALAATAGTFLERDPASHSLRALRAGEWEVWVSDAALVRELAAEARASGVRRVALWRLGLEDPALWGALAGRD